MLITKQTNQPETETQTNQQDTLRETREGEHIQCVKKEVLDVFPFLNPEHPHIKLRAFSNSKFRMLLKNIKKSSCLSRNWPRYLQNSGDKIRIKISKM